MIEQAVKGSLKSIIAMTLVFAAAAHADPFGTGIPWLNWAVLTICYAVGSVVPVIAMVPSIRRDILGRERDINARDYFGWIGASIGVFLIMAGWILGSLHSADEISGQFAGLVWTGYITVFAGMLFSGLVTYVNVATKALPPKESTWQHRLSSATTKRRKSRTSRPRRTRSHTRF